VILLLFWIDRRRYSGLSCEFLLGTHNITMPPSIPSDEQRLDLYLDDLLGHIRFPLMHTKYCFCVGDCGKSRVSFASVRTSVGRALS